jgi:hypothetical protein
MAPPPKTVDWLAAVPIDIQTIDAVFVFDAPRRLRRAASRAREDSCLTMLASSHLRIWWS